MLHIKKMRNSTNITWTVYALTWTVLQQYSKLPRQKSYLDLMSKFCNITYEK